MQSTVLSVVMPCLNGMPGVQQAIESVRASIPAENYEIIVADGGSVDGTLDFLRGAGVTLIEGPDSSLYDGLNKAVAQAGGEYIVWLNSDDLLLPAVADFWRTAREGGSDMATGEALIMAGEKLIWKSNHHAEPMSAASVLFAVPTINSRLMHRALLDKAGPFRCDVGFGADRYMLLKLLRLAERRTFTTSTVYQYQSHGGSRTIGGTWTSYRDVHETNLAMLRALREEAGGAEARLLHDAFGSVSVLARARAELFGGQAGKAFREGLGAAFEYPDPKTWMRGLSLHRRHRGQGSGW